MIDLTESQKLQALAAARQYVWKGDFKQDLSGNDALISAFKAGVEFALKTFHTDVKDRRVLLMASYCGDNPDCTNDLPCLDCLKMSNVATTNVIKDIIGGYDYLIDTK